MAIQGTFLADFSQFTAAVAKAEVSLKSFEAGAGKVETSLDRMTNSLSGVKIVQQATVAAEAVERIGGVSKLTEKELARVGATANEAANKLRAMGQDVPPGIQKIADASNKAREAANGATSSTMNWQKSLLSAASALGIAFSANMLKNFIVGVVNAASNVDDLSKKIGVSREAIQRWSYAAEQSGQTIDTVDRAVSFMNKTLDGGDKSTVAALKAAGLSFDAIRMMKPEDAFNAITRALGDMDDPMARARVAMELFGKTGQDLLPAIAEGFADTAASAKVMSDETIKRLDAAGDAWVKLSNTAIIYSGEMLSATMSTIDRATSSWTNFFKMAAAGLPGNLGAQFARDFAVGGLEAGPVADPQAEAKRQQQVKDSIAAAKAAEAEAKALASAKKSGEEYAAVLSRMAAARVPLTQAQIAQIDLWTKENQSVSDIAKALRVSEVAVSSYLKSMKEYEKNLKTASTVTVGLGNDLKKFGVEVKMSDGLTTNMIQTVKVLGIEWMKTLPGVKVEMGKLPPEIKKASEEIERLKKVGEASLRSLSSAFSDLSRVSSGALSQITGNLATVTSALDHAKNSVGSFKDGLALFKQGDILSGIAGMSTGIMGIVSAAIAAGKAIKAIWGAFDQNKGRDLVKDFAESFGGFDNLQKEIDAMGAAGAGLWVKLTQGVGRNNPEQAARVIAEVEEAMDRYKRAQQESQILTEAGAQATIESASQAALALDELNGRLDVNRDAWRAWSEDVTGYLQQLANNIRALPLPGPTGLQQGSGTGLLSGGIGGTATKPINITVVSELDGAEVARNQVRYIPQELTLMGAGR